MAQETDKALEAIPDNSDWAFYIQGDELIHEKYYENIRQAMLRWKDDDKVDGLLFSYEHFYGSFDYVATSPLWYRNEIRIIRNNKRIYSYRDAQGFRKDNNQKLNVKQTDAYVYHYGWVRHPKFLQDKVRSYCQYWHTDEWMEKNVSAAEFDYSDIDALGRFEGTHPQIMLERINRINWTFDHDISKQNLPLKYKFKLFIKKLTGYHIFEYRNYKLI